MKHHRREGLPGKRGSTRAERGAATCAAVQKAGKEVRCPKCNSAETKYLAYPTLGRVVGSILGSIAAVFVQVAIRLPGRYFADMLVHSLAPSLPHWKCAECGHEWFRPLFGGSGYKSIN